MSGGGATNVAYNLWFRGKLDPQIFSPGYQAGTPTSADNA
jgi:hypothetical protein